MAAQQKKLNAVTTLPAQNVDSYSILMVQNNAVQQVPANTVQGQLGHSYGTPANSGAVTVPGGSVWSDGTYLYVATANNIVKRATLSSF